MGTSMCGFPWQRLGLALGEGSLSGFLLELMSEGLYGKLSAGFVCRLCVDLSEKLHVRL